MTCPFLVCNRISVLSDCTILLSIESCHSLTTIAYTVTMVTMADYLGIVYSNDPNINSCLSTLVWLVSLISPARNISSTTLYTCK